MKQGVARRRGFPGAILTMLEATAAAQSTAELHPVTVAAVGATPQRGGAARPLCGTATGHRPQHDMVEVTATSEPP